MSRSAVYEDVESRQPVNSNEINFGEDEAKAGADSQGEEILQDFDSIQEAADVAVESERGKAKGLDANKYALQGRPTFS